MGSSPPSRRRKRERPLAPSAIGRILGEQFLHEHGIDVREVRRRRAAHARSAFVSIGEKGLPKPRRSRPMLSNAERKKYARIGRRIEEAWLRDHGIDLRTRSVRTGKRHP
ncbi:MAG TPA: hypothetical protein VGR28_02740 [Candidatus Thermoplasmatota archaeon]|jgi:hypothetical protein|nr:hypothetical protein [Candidatus Thermoplasmatota archaeon]